MTSASLPKAKVSPGINPTPIGTPVATRLAVGFKTAGPVAVPIQPRPLAPLLQVMGELNINADRVRALLDVGKLTAFNIATERTGKACLRILLASVHSYCQTGKNKFIALPWTEIFKLVWPFPKAGINGIEMAGCLNCDRGHIEDLILAKQFQVVKAARPGPKGSPQVTLASFEAFLKGRLL